MSKENLNSPQEVEGNSAAQEQPEAASDQQTQTQEVTVSEPSQTEQTEQTAETDYSEIENPEEASKVLESKGFDYEALTKEFQENGDLSKETRAALEKQGITGEILDSYIEGQKAIVTRQMEDISTVVGGMENMAAVIEWAKANLSEEEKKAIDSVHNPAVIKIILKDLKNRMNDEEGYLPEQLQGGAGASAGDYFESMAEVEAAINDPKYSNDPVYRQKVGKKIHESKKAGILEIK